MKVNHSETIRRFYAAWNGTRRGLTQCGDICASIAEREWSGWRLEAIKLVQKEKLRLTEDMLDDLRLVGQHNLIPELIQCQSLAERLVRQLPVSEQLAAITKKVDVAVASEGKWVRKKKYLSEIKDQSTARRVIDLEANKIRTYAEQCQMNKPSGRAGTRTLNQTTYADPAQAAFMRTLTEQDMRVFRHLKECVKCSPYYEQVEAHMEYSDKRKPVEAAVVEAVTAIPA